MRLARKECLSSLSLSRIRDRELAFFRLCSLCRPRVPCVVDEKEKKNEKWKKKTILPGTSTCKPSRRPGTRARKLSAQTEAR